MSAHTPGPWSVEPCSEDAEIVNIVANARTLPDGRRQANWIAECDLQDGRIEENHANARVIAAAPELLATLKRLRDAVFRHGITEDDSWPVTFQEVIAALHAADAAIANAEGGRSTDNGAPVQPEGLV